VNRTFLYTVLQFTATLDTPPQIAVNKQWRYITVLTVFPANVAKSEVVSICKPQQS
jgi:hypothetical protein